MLLPIPHHDTSKLRGNQVQSVKGGVLRAERKATLAESPGSGFVPELPCVVALSLLEHVSTIDLKSGIVDELA